MRVHEEAFEALKKELKHYDLQEVADAAGVTSSCLCLWLSDNSPEFPYIYNFLAVAGVIGLKVELRILR